MKFAEWAVSVAERYLPELTASDREFIAYREFDIVAYSALFQGHEDGTLTEEDRRIALDFVDAGHFGSKSSDALKRIVLQPLN